MLHNDCEFHKAIRQREQEKISVHMKKINIKFPKNNTRLGFHYYPDSTHYREIDLKYWLPELKLLNASWLVLESSFERAIPENFITSLVQSDIEPIIHFKAPLSVNNDPETINPILQAYSRWGVQKVIFFDQPNNREFWKSSEWARNNLIDIFLKIFLPFAETSLDNDLIPVLPPLEPGGHYWDTTFQKSLLESLFNLDHQDLLNNLVFSCYAWTGYKNLTWGEGGQEKWKKSIPYSTPAGEEDQKGFRIFDWYTEISRKYLDRIIPTILLGVGAPENPSKVRNRSQFKDSQIENSLSIARLIQGEKVFSTDNCEKSLNTVPNHIFSCNFWILSAGKNDPLNSQAWYQSDRQRLPLVQSWKNWAAKTKQSKDEAVQAEADKLRLQKENETDFGKPPVLKDSDLIPDEKVEDETIELEEQTGASDEEKFSKIPGFMNTTNLMREQILSQTRKKTIRCDEAKRYASNSENEKTRPLTSEKRKFNMLRPIEHYLLLPSTAAGVSDWHLEVIRPFVIKHKPTIGFSLKEAVLAKNVTVIGNQDSFPEEILERLRASGCNVERISGDGTKIATILSMR